MIPKELIPKKRRKPLLIGNKLDEQVRDYIKELRREGIDCDAAIAVGKEIVVNSNTNLLLANSGHIDLTKQ